ncbi:NAD(P)H-dependent glycerol-3-phosphate dehydrogenase [Vibrio sp.]|nr:NAD(P)H-dependent glycerol-3-phosphate dehydrogenase [Vibrio sp.]
MQVKVEQTKAEQTKAVMTVIGAGSYGTSLAMALARSGQHVVLWGHNPEHIKVMQSERKNQRFLPDISFPDSLTIEGDLGKAISASKDLLIVVPSHAFSDVLLKVKPHLSSHSRLCWATKGLEPETGRLLQEVVFDSIGDGYSLAMLSGPTFAKELAIGLPTAIAVSSPDPEFLKDLQNKIHCSKTFRVYANDDFIGMQLGGAVKNVIAIGAGISDGIGFGANARTALITRGLAEMCRLGAALGAKQETFMGMAGLGDLVLTCTDNQSRNRRFGLALGQGKSVDVAQEEISQVVEGYRNTLEVWVLSQRLGVDMPIVTQIHEVLYNGKPAETAAKDLLAREKTNEK